MKRHLALLVSALFLLATVGFAHRDGLDAYRGHHDRKAGTHHFHRGPLTGHSFASKAEALRALSARHGPATQAAPQADRQE